MTKFPIVGSSAAQTPFVWHRFEGPDGFLYLDGNGKVTAGNGSYTEPKPNALSLPNISCCPFRTPTCEAACYASGISEHRQNLADMYTHNAGQLQRILAGTRYRWAVELGGWIQDNAAGGFRWHVSGDIVSMEHAEWIALVAEKSPRVRHWIYTRSFPFLEPLAGVSNLTVNLSGDRDNWGAARRVHDRYGFRLTYLTVDGALPDELPDGSVIFPDYRLRGRHLDDPTQGKWWQALGERRRRMVCGADYFGSSESYRCGPCKKCL
jgi:hypothetical protein